MTLDDLRALFAEKNIGAFYRVMREGESSQSDEAYHMLVYGGRFTDFSDHPRQHFDRTTHLRVPDWRHAPPNSTTSAAGSGQIVERTWDEQNAIYHFPDFSPPSQDLVFVALLVRAQAIDALLAGDLGAAIVACRPVWTSLPGAAENTRVSIAKASWIFDQYGGVLA